jgi:hypothetical protein
MKMKKFRDLFIEPPLIGLYTIIRVENPGCPDDLYMLLS